MRKFAIRYQQKIIAFVSSFYYLPFAGPSGCGKTTLLQCIVGKRLLDSGQILVFGGKPGSRQRWGIDTVQYSTVQYSAVQ